MFEMIFIDGSSIEIIEQEDVNRINLVEKWDCLYQEALENGSAHLSQDFGEVKIRIKFSLSRLNDIFQIRTSEEVLKVEKEWEV